MPKDQEFALVHEAQDPYEAEVICALLKDKGIEAFIPDKNSPFPGVDLTPFADGGRAGCDVFVPKGELEKAKNFIAESKKED